jgi:hypothetical protein
MKTFLYFVILTVLLSINVKAQSFGNALRFDGVNDYVDLGNATTFDVGTAVTYEAWINPDSSSSGFILNKLVSWQEDKQFGLSGGSIYFYLYNVFGGTQLFSSPSIPAHQYTHVAATYDGSLGLASIYINGVFDTSKSVGSVVSNSIGNLYCGFNPVRNGWLAPFNGIIDEVRIWNIARTESEVQSTMNQALIGNEAGLTGYWKFDEGTDTIAYDATGNHNNGAISGATWVISGVLHVVETIGGIPEDFSLEQNYPNPFNPNTKIRWQSPISGRQTLTVFDVHGRMVATLVNEEKPAGSYEVEFDASGLSSGIYFYTLQAGNFIQMKKMALIR